MHSFSDIIRAWPGLAEFKRDMGVPTSTAQSWRDRDSIPNPHWKRLVDKAQARGIKGVTYSVLGKLEPGACAKDRDAASTMQGAA
jgi:hypothetical protein